ncbi:MAG: MFS transporter, partial [Chitinophagaceae bacterium]|nr:MFS transporter [Chitinophagaceae bacterium]
GFTFASWASRIPHIQGQLGLSEAALGTVLLALPIGLMISLLLAGGLITRIGSKPVLLLASCLYAVVLCCLGLATHTWQLVLGLFFFGIAGNLFNIAVNTQGVAVEKLYGRSILASFHGIWSLAGFSGAAVGMLMVNLALAPWQHFMIAAAIGVLLMLLAQPYLLRQQGHAGKQPAFAWPDKKIMQLGLIAFGCLVCEGTMFDWSGVYFKKVIQAPAAIHTLGYSLFMGCMAAGRFVADKVVMRVGTRRMLQGSGIVITAGLLLAVLWPATVPASIGFMLVGFGVSSVVPIVYSQAGQSQTMHPGQALAAVSTVGFLGFLAGPPIIGFVAEASSLRWSFALVALIGLSTTVLAGTLKSKPGPAVA